MGITDVIVVWLKITQIDITHMEITQKDITYMEITLKDTTYMEITQKDITFTIMGITQKDITLHSTTGMYRDVQDMDIGSERNVQGIYITSERVNRKLENIPQ